MTQRSLHESANESRLAAVAETVCLAPNYLPYVVQTPVGIVEAAYASLRQTSLSFGQTPWRNSATPVSRYPATRIIAAWRSCPAKCATKPFRSRLRTHKHRKYAACKQRIERRGIRCAPSSPTIVSNALALQSDYLLASQGQVVFGQLCLDRDFAARSDGFASTNNSS